MKAVQRKVFPGGGSQYFEPQIAPAPATPTPAPGTPASSPVADLMARVNALESQLATLTGQTEQNAFKLRQLERSEEHTSELQSLMSISYSVFCLKQTHTQQP